MLHKLLSALVKDWGRIQAPPPLPDRLPLGSQDSPLAQKCPCCPKLEAAGSCWKLRCPIPYEITEPWMCQALICPLFRALHFCCISQILINTLQMLYKLSADGMPMERSLLSDSVNSSGIFASDLQKRDLGALLEKQRSEAQTQAVLRHVVFAR